MNMLDKAIAYVSPEKAVRRLQSRGMLALAGGYSGARMDRAALAGWRPGTGSPSTDIDLDLPTLRARSRDLARNAPVATGAINTSVTHVVGTGLSLKPRIDAEYLGLTEPEAEQWIKHTMREFKNWAESVDCDVARRLNFYGIQSLAFRSALESGDAHVLTPMIKRPGRAYDLALQIIEADRICNEGNMPDSETLVGGVEINPQTGEAIRYHVAKSHPGDLRRVVGWDKVDAYGAQTGRRNVLAVMEQLRPGQVRGVPMLAPVIEPLKQIGTYTNAELQAAVTSGLYSVFIKMDPAAFAEMFDDEGQGAFLNRAKGWSGELEAGQAINLLPGESIESANPGRPNAQFDPFVQAIIAQIGTALEIPYEVLIMRFQSSYSAARAAMLMAWRLWRRRRDLLITTLCQPVYALFLDEAVGAGRIHCPGYFSDPSVRLAWQGSEWIGDGPGSMDPQKEIKAASDRVALGISTLEAESILYDGVDWETKYRTRVREQRMMVEGGLVEAVNAGAPVEPDDETSRDEEEAPKQ
ncbi:phage portal protein [Pigmentiphaga litoralis]|uniref:phage portal protein n=1 Tax=Pigmentiphaga litoralis TaxID=516702 RepID=UPI00167B50E8|nr:phage portal protein [Pigmentiphaga litoralis]